MKRPAAIFIALVIAAPAVAQTGPVIGASAQTHRPPTLAEARECAAATGYWVTLRRAAKQSARTYETLLEAWSTYIEKQSGEAETKVHADILADVQLRGKSRDSSWALDALVACAAFERPPAPPSSAPERSSP